MNNYRFTTASAEQTKALAEELLPVLDARCVLIRGELGAGKTEFARGVARALGVTEEVTSPTFVLEQQYDCAGELAEKIGIKRLCHWDCYRLGSHTQDLELFEEFEDQHTLVLVEWPEKFAFPELLPFVDISIKIPSAGDGQVSDREFVVQMVAELSIEEIASRVSETR